MVSDAGRLGHTTPLRQQHIDLPQLRDDLVGLALLLRHGGLVQRFEILSQEAIFRGQATRRIGPQDARSMPDGERSSAHLRHMKRSRHQLDAILLKRGPYLRQNRLADLELMSGPGLVLAADHQCPFLEGTNALTLERLDEVGVQLRVRGDLLPDLLEQFPLPGRDRRVIRPGFFFRPSEVNRWL